MEALYQALTGAGYDLDCDFVFDPTTDVLPFLASEDDPFRGVGGERFDAGLSGAGLLGGMGLRDDALPILVYVTDNLLRDPDAGYGSPGGCTFDAGREAVVDAATRAGAKLVGLATKGAVPVPQMNDLAVSTGSLADLDADGAPDDPLVFEADAEHLAALVSNGVTAALRDAVIARVSLVVRSDPAGAVVSIEPNVHEAVAAGTELGFLLRAHGDVSTEFVPGASEIVLGLYADDRFLLDGTTLYVAPPGS